MELPRFLLKLHGKDLNVLMRYIGLDVGDRTIGVAVSDPLGYTAQGITTVRRKSLEKDLLNLKEIFKKQSCC